MAKCPTCTFNNNVIAYRHPQMSPSVRVSVTSFASFEAMRDSFFFLLYTVTIKNTNTCLTESGGLANQAHPRHSAGAMCVALMISIE
jgi:hypothetical protein